MISSSEIQRQILKLLQDEKIHSVQEIKIFLKSIGIEDYTEGQFAGSLNTLVRRSRIVKKDRGLYKINKLSLKNKIKTCFIVSPIGEEGSETRNNADKLFKHVISPVCKDCGFIPVRVDQLNDFDSITQTILEKLESVELVIADISEHNPNVFYEMGYRKCTNKPIIHLKKKGEAIPFDVNSIRTFEYDLTDLDSVEEIKTRLKQTISAFNFEEQAEEDITQEQIEKLSSVLLPTLYKMQDSISEIKNMLTKKNINEAEKIMEKYVLTKMLEYYKDSDKSNTIITTFENIVKEESETKKDV